MTELEFLWCFINVSCMHHYCEGTHKNETAHALYSVQNARKESKTENFYSICSITNTKKPQLIQNFRI